MALVLALCHDHQFIVAATAGTIIPLIMHSQQRPCCFSHVFITTATDVLGLHCLFWDWQASSFSIMTNNQSPWLFDPKEQGSSSLQKI